MQTHLIGVKFGGIFFNEYIANDIADPFSKIYNEVFPFNFSDACRIRHLCYINLSI